MSKPKKKRVDWKKAAMALAKCALFTINNHKHLARGTGMMVCLSGPDRGKSMGPWQEQFFDALELIGATVNRKGYWDSLEPKRGRR